MIGQRTATPDLDDTIVALASPPGAGLRAIVRLSGRDAARIVRSLIPEFEPDPFEKRQVACGGINLPDVASTLPADVFFFRAPATYTGQDIVEIHTISSMPLVELTIAELLRAGARGARPGEFTMRGFLAGKLDLTRAEAVHAVIEATRPDQLKRALVQLAGGLARPLDHVRDDLLNLLADVEAGLDFSDEDLSFVEQPQLLGRLAKALAQVTLVGKQIQERGASGTVFRVAIAGPPNAGKSSLFNALVGRDAALVGPAAGTTRDYLEADIVVNGAVIRLIDTAGLGSPADPLDAAAQDLSRDRLADADLVLWCKAAGDENGDVAASFSGAKRQHHLAPEDCDVKPYATLDSGLGIPQGPQNRGNGAALRALSETEQIEIVTKADLIQTDVKGRFVSAFTGLGMAELKALFADKANAHGNPLAPSLSRCRHHVAACLDYLRRAHRLALEKEPAELLAIELRLALDEAGAIVGSVYTDDLLDRIFSRFCIGK